MENDIEINGNGFYSIQAVSDAGQEWVSEYVDLAENGLAYSDDTRMTADIAEGAFNDGLAVAVNGREYIGNGAVAD